MSKSVGTKKQWRRYVCLGLLVTMAMLSLSCYGHFPLTHAVYRMNGNAGGGIGEDQTQHKMVQSAVFWVFWIIPVYEVAILVDAVVLNLIEFWTDDVVEISSVQEHNGTRVTLLPGNDGHEAVLAISQNGKLLTEQHVVKVSDTTFEMRDVSGNLTGKIFKTPEGGVQLADAQGRIVRTLAAEDLATLARR